MIAKYIAAIAGSLGATCAHDNLRHKIPLDVACLRLWRTACTTHHHDRKIMFIGNGGSAGIASHLAIDFSKNAGLRAQAFNDAAALTCLGNDLGYENVFAEQIKSHAKLGDLLIAISSSGRSENILGAVKAARNRCCNVITLSGFGSRNRLRRMGDLNFYVPSHRYGLVEIAHLALCHAALDIGMGWKA